MLLQVTAGAGGRGPAHYLRAMRRLGHGRGAIEARLRELARDGPVELRYITELAIYTRRN